MKKSFELIRSNLMESGIFPHGLTGACFASAFMSDFILKKNGIKSEIVANNRHCFNRFYQGGKSFILDLTATQISRERFEEISILSEQEAKGRLTKFKRAFYDDDLVFSGSKDLLFPKEGESLKVAEPLVEKLCGLVEAPDLLSEYKNVQSLPGLQAFADKLVSRSEKALSQRIIKPEGKSHNDLRQRHHASGPGSSMGEGMV